MQEDIFLSRLNHAFAQFLSQLSALDNAKRKQFKAVITRLSYAQRQGHSCIELSETEQNLVLASGLTDNSGKCPLVLEDKNLYLQRYWSYECQLAKKIVVLTTTQSLIGRVDNIINQYFSTNAAIDWQKEASISAIKNSFTMITGGPGTGKTTTVVKILGLLQEVSPQPLKIALATPTGKAAMRLQESIAQSKNELPCAEAIKQTIPQQVVTLHRLLGARPPSVYFKYNAKNLLPFDIVVIDEASMIDLPLMSKLVCALKNNTRLILLGDKNQLASVETGTVFADLTLALPDHTQALKKSYRFSGYIKVFADAVNQQKGEDAWALLNQEHAQLCLLKEHLIDYIVSKQIVYLQLIFSGAEFVNCFVAFNAFQVLCATQRGKNSVDDINQRVVQKLKQRKFIQNTGEWYSGRPIMVMQNEPVLHLYNGDIGICRPDAENGGQLMVYFLLPDGAIRKYTPARLSHCETVFAMTIHKSQGSEFNEVLLVLPEKMSPVLSKELIYTGITRAKESFKLLANQTIFLQAIQRKVERYSGLASRIKKMI